MMNFLFLRHLEKIFFIRISKERCLDFKYKFSKNDWSLVGYIIRVKWCCLCFILVKIVQGFAGLINLW